jgi:hypothetical protein
MTDCRGQEQLFRVERRQPGTGCCSNAWWPVSGGVPQRPPALLRGALSPKGEMAASIAILFPEAPMGRGAEDEGTKSAETADISSRRLQLARQVGRPSSHARRWFMSILPPGRRLCPLRSSRFPRGVLQNALQGAFSLSGRHAWRLKRRGRLPCGKRRASPAREVESTGPLARLVNFLKRSTSSPCVRGFDRRGPLAIA